MGESLKARTVSAISWSFVQEVAGRGLQFGIGIFLARILSPKEFGLVAMLSVFIAVAQAMIDGGFASALIQRKEPTEAHKCSIFYFNIIVSVLLAVLLWLAAPRIAAFYDQYDQPLLTTMMRVFALIPVMNGFSVVQNALLIRHLELRKQTVLVVVSTGVSGSFGVTLAWRGFGIWSLVWQQVIQSLVRSTLLWWLSAWRPKWLFSLKALREMFAFGWGMLASVLMNTIFDNLNPLIIGKCFSASALGYFNRAQALQTISSQSLGTIANRVTFPVFSGLQDDLGRFRSGLRKAMTIIGFVQFPMMVGLAVVAKPLILVVFGEKWAPSIPYLQLLAFAGLLYPVHMLNVNVLLSLGHSDLFLRLGVIKFVLVVVNALVTYRWGVSAMIWGLIACSVVSYFLNTYYSKQLIGYSAWDQLRDLYPYLTASALMGIVVTLAGYLLPLGNVWQLGFGVVLGTLTYLSICRSLRLQAFGELMDIVLRKRAPAAVAQ